MDLVQLTWNPPPLKMDYVFHHCFIVLFQFFDIIFTLKFKKKKTWKVDSAQNPPPPCGLSPSKCFFVFFYFPYSLGRVQYSIVKLFIFYFYLHPLRKRESTDGHFLLLFQLFPTSNFLFLPGWKKTQVLFPPVTRDQPDMTWPHPPPML